MKAIKTLILWFYIKTVRVGMEKRIVHLIDFGTAFVFAKQTDAELAVKAPYTEVYWRYTPTNTIYGPFPDLVTTLNHYASYEKPKIMVVEPCNTIEVDFKLRKRI